MSVWDKLIFLVWSASSPNTTILVITQNGFRATGSVFEVGWYNYDNPGTTSIDTGSSVTFKNATSHPIKLCLSQRGECVTQVRGPREFLEGLTLNPGQSCDVTFNNVGDYLIEVYTPDGSSFKYPYLKVGVTEPSD